MTLLSPTGEFTRGDHLSRILIDVCADRDPGGLTADAGLLELAQRHGLVGLLAEHLTDPLVRAINVRETARRSVLETHLSRILAGLDDAGVRVAVLKGPAVAARYRNPRQRPFSDIDILVPEDEMGTALDYLSQYPATLRVPPKRPKADKRDVLIGDESGIVFNCDLHWDLFSYTQLRRSADGATEAAWEETERRSESPLGPMWEIPDAYRLAFLASHAVLDHRFRLILFRDFLEMSKQPLDWDEVARVAHRWGLRSTTYLALWLSKELVGAEIDPWFLSSLRPSSAPLRFLEWALPRTDIVRFNGHRPHPVNLAAVLLNDSRAGRASLLIRAPSAFPNWQRRVKEDAGVVDISRVLIVASTDRRRGAEVGSERLRDGLVRRGLVVEAVCLRAYGEEPRASLEPLRTGSRVDGEAKVDLGLALALRRRLRQFRPDVVIANGGATLRYSVISRIGIGCKLVYVGIGEPDYWIRSGLSRWVNRLLLRRTDWVLAVSDQTRRGLVELEPAIADRASVAYRGIPDHFFSVRSAKPVGGLRLLMIGSLTSEKDPVRALRVVSAIPGARLRFVGTGPLLEDLQIETPRLGMEARVEYAGSVEDVIPHLEWAHVLILTSRSEGLPGAVIEAGAAGVPTVAVDVGGIREAVIDQVTGFITGRRDDDLIDRLMVLHADRERLVRMSEAARAHVRARFNSGVSTETYVRLLERLAK